MLASFFDFYKESHTLKSFSRITGKGDCEPGSEGESIAYYVLEGNAL